MLDLYGMVTGGSVPIYDSGAFGKNNRTEWKIIMSTPEQELARAKEEYEKAKAQAKARYDQARARHTSNARKLDTRRKVIAGGALFELASRDVEAALVLDRILESITRDVDRKAFEDWERPGGKAKEADAREGKTDTGREAPSPAGSMGRFTPERMEEMFGSAPHDPDAAKT